MPPLPPTSMATRKRTRSTNVTENNIDPLQTASTNTISTTTTTATSVNISSLPTNIVPVNAPPKRQRNNPPTTGPPPPVPPRTSYSFRNRSLTPDPRHPSTRFPSLHAPTSRSTTRQRYNLRPRRPQSQTRLPQVPTPQPTVAPRRIRRPIPPIAQTTPSSSTTNLNQSSALPTRSSSPSAPPPVPSTLTNPTPVLPVIPSVVTLPTPPVIQPRQYRLVYISDEDDETGATAQTTTFNLTTEDGVNRSQPTRPRRTSRTTSGVEINGRLRAGIIAPSSAASTSSSSSSSSSNSSSLTTINTQDFISGVAHVRLNRAIEIVIDSIQSLEGAVNNFDQLVFGLIYGRLGTRAEFESIEGMIRLSRILNLNVSSRLSQDEIDALPKIIFVNKTGPTASIQLAEKCPICLTEFDDEETINKLHCTHLFHLQCISTWLSENDSCPTCRRKVIGD